MNVDLRHPVLSTFGQLKSRISNLLQGRSRAFFQPSSRSLFTATTARTCPRNLAIRTIASHSGQMTTPNPEHEHFFRYTSGRWLWEEEKQLRDRYKAFNVAELQSLAAKAMGSDGCVSMTKLAEGGYNKVFRLVMNDGKAVLARIPNPNAGPPFYATASEVATMEFVSCPRLRLITRDDSCVYKAREFLQIPVPRVLGWSATSHNSVCSEYIIMEEATGTQLGILWDELSPDSKLSIMRGVVSVETKLLSVSFSQYVFFPIHCRIRMLTFSSSATEAFILRVTLCKAQSQPRSPARLPPN